MGQDPRRTDLTVDVTAPVPKQTDPWPANIREILLGTATKGPTGFAADERGPGSMPADMAGVYGELAGAAPRVAARVGPSYELGDPTGLVRRLVGLAGYVPGVDATVFTAPPTAERLAHETTHRMQMGNYPSRAAGSRAWNPRGPGELAYLDAPGEQQAYKVEELVRDELLRQLKARRR